MFIVIGSSARLRQIEQLMKAIDAKLDTLKRLGETQMATLDDLLQDVKENSDAVDSAVVLLKGLKDKLDAAGTDPVKLAELSAAIDAQTAKLANAVTENTPAA